MNCIAAVDSSWSIGRGGSLLVSIPADMKFFREMTLGKTVIVGRKTLESFPRKQPLKGRKNIVLTRDRSYLGEGAVVVHSVEEALKEAEKTPSEDVFVIGGESVYRAFLPCCDTAYITKIDYRYDADTSFPNLDEDPEWALFEEGEEQTSFDLEFRFCVYRRIRQTGS